MRVRIARDELRRLRELTQAIKALENEIAEPIAQVAPQLLSEPGFGPLTAAKLVGEIAGADRFATDAKLARAAGLAPIPVSSGRTNRHRLDRGGNRQVNAAVHRVAVARARSHPETRDYIARKTAEGKTHREAIRCLKRHLARRIWQLPRINCRVRRAGAPSPAGDCDSEGREGERGAAGQTARALPVQPLEQKMPAVSVRLIACAPVALADHARAGRPGLDQVAPGRGGRCPGRGRASLPYAAPAWRGGQPALGVA